MGPREFVFLYPCKNAKVSFYIYRGRISLSSGWILAHQRQRHLEGILSRLVSFSPILGIFGHRQVGKTTLLSKICNDYVTLDVRAQRARVELDPEGFLASVDKFPMGIDEAQLVPDLFPALKDRVRLQKRPGQFILSGSVRFTSRKAIRESLTGRIVNVELLPMTQAELDGRPANHFLIRAFSGDLKSLEKLIDSMKQHDSWGRIERYLHTGGLPGVSFIRSDQQRYLKFESQLETILDRDLRLIVDTRLEFSTLRNVLVNLAMGQGLPLELKTLSRKTHVSVPTIKVLLQAFEKVFLIRKLETRGTEKRPVVFFEDQGEATHLVGRPLDPLSDLTRFVFSQIRVPLQLVTDRRVEYFQYRTRGGAHLPLAIQCGSNILGILPILQENPNRQEVGSATSFLNRFSGSRVMFVHPQKKFGSLGKNLIIVPVSALI